MLAEVGSDGGEVGFHGGGVAVVDDFFQLTQLGQDVVELPGGVGVEEDFRKEVVIFAH